MKRIAGWLLCLSLLLVIYVATGEGKPRNRVSFGDGIYKSLDGGRTWKHLGLSGYFVHRFNGQQST